MMNVTSSDTVGVYFVQDIAMIVLVFSMSEY